MARKASKTNKRRDSGGRFRKGVSGNPSGRPRIHPLVPPPAESKAASNTHSTSLSADFAAIVRHYSDTKLPAIARRLVKDAQGGDRWAVEQVLRLREADLRRQEPAEAQARKLDLSRLTIEELRTLLKLTRRAQRDEPDTPTPEAVHGTGSGSLAFRATSGRR